MQIFVDRHIDALTPERLARLVNVHGALCLSLYMPTVRSGDQTRQNPIRYKNLCKRAADMLAERQTPGAVVDALTARLGELDGGDPRFWEHQSDGLAVFVSEDDFDSLRLPQTFAECVCIGATFDVLSLLPALRLNARFALLNLDLNRVRLYTGSALSLDVIDLPDVAESLRDHLGSIEHERQLRMHSVGGDGGSVVFHGHGPDDRTRKDEMREFFRLLDAALCRALAAEHLPLVLAGTPANRGLYREVSRYPHLMGAGIEIDREADDPGSLHARALPVARALAESEVQAALARMQTGARRVTGIEAVLPAAQAGRIDTLFVPEDLRIPGRFDADQGILHGEGDGDDLLNQAVVFTLVQGGQVYSVAPSASPAALLRY
ncbi:MAG: hypothetical protein IT320_02705 [Anaerolineae bacterium]|nr:hypothetical protein [Anaerolineae bacterium]